MDELHQLVREMQQLTAEMEELSKGLDPLEPKHDSTMDHRETEIRLQLEARLERQDREIAELRERISRLEKKASRPIDGKTIQPQMNTDKHG